MILLNKYIHYIVTVVIFPYRFYGTIYFNWNNNSYEGKNMLKSIKYAALAGAIVVAAGCQSFNANKPSAPLEPRLVTNQLRADIKVGEKISGESSINVLFKFIAFGGDSKFADGIAYDGMGSAGAAGGSGLAGLPIPLPLPTDPTEQVKSAAAYNALAASGGEILISPRYEISVEDYFVFKTIHVKVTGYKGTVSNIVSTNVY